MMLVSQVACFLALAAGGPFLLKAQTSPPPASPAQSTPAQTAPAQTPPAQNPSVQISPPQNPPEMNTRDEQASFKSRVNLVMVPVVVRNAQGNAVGNLTKDNFQLFDKGKPQEIARFSVEKTAVTPADSNGKAPAPVAPPTAEGAEPEVIVPERFVAFVFDDIHLASNDLAKVREAADQHIENMVPTDRLALYSMSGEMSLDFTDDRRKLHAALASIRPAVMVRVGALNDFDQRVLLALSNLKAIVKRMSVVPGQRTVVLVSPGFNTLSGLYTEDKAAIIEQAIRSKVIISSLDARGLYTDPRFNVAPGGGRSLTSMYMAGSLMAELASGTGGQFFENSNGFEEGFRRLAAAPEYLYLLGFSPQNLKSDGSFHTLKVTLKNAPSLTLTARHGYYAPKRTDDAMETARQEIESALFSRDEMMELPIEMHTQFFSTGDLAKLSVMAHLDLKQFKFHKADGRNHNEVTLVAGIFDRNGNYLQGIKKVVELRLKDETLAHMASGVTVKTTFDVKPGTYIVRLVVRDTEGQALSATNGAVNIQ
jgi:VWFA-related protein